MERARANLIRTAAGDSVLSDVQIERLELNTRAYCLRNEFPRETYKNREKRLKRLQRLGSELSKALDDSPETRPENSLSAHERQAIRRLATDAQCELLHRPKPSKSAAHTNWDLYNLVSYVYQIWREGGGRGVGVNYDVTSEIHVGPIIDLIRALLPADDCPSGRMIEHVVKNNYSTWVLADPEPIRQAESRDAAHIQMRDLQKSAEDAVQNMWKSQLDND